MFYLVLSILSFVAFIVLLWRYKKTQIVDVVETELLGNKNVVMLDDDDLIVEEEEVGDGRLQKASIGCLLLGVLCFTLFVVTRTPEKAHNVQLSYEGFALYQLGNALTKYFSDSTATSAIDTLVIAPDPESAYISELIKQVKRGLNAEKFNVLGVYPVVTPPGTKTDAVVTSNDLAVLLDDYPEIGLVVLLVEFRPDDEISWQTVKRPYIAIFSAQAEFNRNVALLNQGIIDMALVSKGKYIDHSIIPPEIPLETIFKDNFLLINPVNLREIVREHKQTVSANPKARK